MLTDLRSLLCGLLCRFIPVDAICPLPPPTVSQLDDESIERHKGERRIANVDALCGTDSVVDPSDNPQQPPTAADTQGLSEEDPTVNASDSRFLDAELVLDLGKTSSKAKS